MFRPEFEVIRETRRFKFDAGLGDFNKAREISSQYPMSEDARKLRRAWWNIEDINGVIRLSRRGNGIITFQVEIFPSDNRQEVFAEIREKTSQLRSVIQEILQKEKSSA